MKKLASSLVILIGLVTLLFFSEGIAEQFGENLGAVSRAYFRYGLQAATWLSGAHVVTRILDVLLWDRLARRLLERSPPRIFRDIVVLLIFAIAISGIIATVLDRSITGLWATSGVVSLVAGLALKDLILDTACGIALGVEKPFGVGDWIEVQGNRRENHVVACVTQVNWRTTRLKSTSNNIIVIPNRRLCEVTITNFRAADPVCRTEFTLVFPLSLPHEQISAVLLDAIHEATDGEKLLADPAPEVRLAERTLAGQAYEVRYFFSSMHMSPGMAKDLGMRAVSKGLRGAGLQTAEGLSLLESLSNQDRSSSC